MKKEKALIGIIILGVVLGLLYFHLTPVFSGIGIFFFFWGLSKVISALEGHKQ